MRKIKRSSYLFFLIGETPLFDAAAFLRGELRIETESHLEALSLLTGDRQGISPAQLEWLCRLSTRTWSPAARWTDDPALGDASLEDLAGRGWLLCDAEAPELAGLRRREELLKSCQWHPYAALYHFLDREQGATPVDLAALSESAARDAEDFVRRYGPPPDPFYSAGCAGPRVDLPLDEKSGQLYEALANRRSIRAFDNARSLQLRDLATLLRYTFGCHGTLELSPETLLVHKTSPSGGSLHPIEAYPLVLDVEGLAPGLYHYDIRAHALEPLEELDRGQAAELAADLANGQLYAGSAHALVLMTVRFFRNHWKYRRRSRTYGVMLMDAGHLSQTFYLVAAELGLGAFYTAAVDGPRIEATLGLEPEEEGALAICGCGVRKTAGDDLGLAFQPFVPRQTDP